MPSSDERPAASASRLRRTAWVVVGIVCLGAVALGAYAGGGALISAPPDARVSPTATRSASPSPTVTPSPEPTPSYSYRESLALTPPMGWNSWNHLRCYDLTEHAVRAAADAIVARGLAELGYEYIVVDDCWQAGRDADGVLVADPQRFPSGIPALADYVHALGLKFGIYAVPGSLTCANHWDSYPVRGIGSLGYEELDARTFAEWGVDYLKYDWCRADINDGIDKVGAFTLMSQLLDRTGRDIVYSVVEYGDDVPWEWAPGIANLWRTEHDLHPRWPVLHRHIEVQADLAPFARPGAWNDPDMLHIGNGFTPDEAATHMAMWVMMAAPLFLGTDVAALSGTDFDLVSNRELIAIGQDPLGRAGGRVLDLNGTQVWMRELAGGDHAVAFWNTTEGEASHSLALADLGIDGEHLVRDVVQRRTASGAATTLDATIPAHGTVMYRLIPTGSLPALPPGRVPG